MNHPLLAIVIMAAFHTVCHAQNFPDRAINYDPLGEHRYDSAGFSALTGSNLHAEFGRYSNGSGGSHRWTAKTGGTIELARWDSSWSIAIVGTAEITIDPHNDIAFNPRAISWEEGVMVSRRIGRNMALQLGAMQRCKHDIDNVESMLSGGHLEERTLIYSGATIRLLLRPHALLPGSDLLRGGLALRNELYVHTLDHRIAGESDAEGRSLEAMIASHVLIGRLELHLPESRVAAHLSGSLMLTYFGERFGVAGYDAGAITAFGSVPHLELGVDLINPIGGTLSIFARGEWQRDAAILPKPQPARLFLLGVRFGDAGTMW